MTIHFHVNVQREGGYLYTAADAAMAAARAEAAFQADDDDRNLSVTESGTLFVIHDVMRDGDDTYLRTYVSVDPCDDPYCQVPYDGAG